MMERGDTGSPAGVGQAWTRRHDGLTVSAVRDLVAGPDLLTDDERTCLERLGLEANRRAAWVRGRVLARRLLGEQVSVIADLDGRPLAAGWSDGFAHDGRWTAAIVAPYRPTVVDIVAGGPARAAAALRRVQVVTDAEPTATWAALECALKLAGWHVAALLDRPVSVASKHDHLEVTGLAAPVIVQIARVADATVAWSTGALP